MRHLRFIAVVIATLLSAAAYASGEEDSGDHVHPHHLAFFIGGGYETGREGEESDKGLVTGVEYEYRFRHNWGIGGVVEALGGDTIREVSMVVPVSLHPHSGWRIFAGPGYEFTEKKDKALFRIGSGYSFHLNDRWVVAPEVLVDFINGGATVFLAGVAFGFGF